MASPQKKTRPSWLLWLLLAIVVLILLCSAGLAYIFLRSSSTDSSALNATSLPLYHPVVPKEETTTTTRTTSRPITTSTERMEETTVPTTTSTKGTTEGATTTLTATTVKEVVTMPPTTEANKELLSSCSAIISAQVSCSRTTSDVTALSPDAFSPLLYKLNLSLNEPLPKRNIEIRGGVQIFFKMNKEGKQISLNAAQTLRGIDDVAVVDCESGRTICVSKSVSEGDDLSLILAEDVPAGSVLRLEFPQFSTVIDGRQPKNAYTKAHVRKIGRGLVKQSMIGSKLKNHAARSIFPAFDTKETTARLSLCLKHWQNSQARSNSPVDFTTSEQTCFRPSHPITADQAVFVAFEGTELLLMNETVLNGQQIPTVEIFIDSMQKNKTEKHKAVQEQTSHIISTLSSWFGYPYPQKKLTIIYGPLQSDFLSSLGIITLPDPAFEYSYHNRYHELLTRALISQWTDGILSSDDCLQVALTIYLEWKLDETYGWLERTAKKEGNVVRPGDLSVDSSRPSRYSRALPTSDCSMRDTAIFYTLDETYGNTTVTQMVREVLRKKAFGYVSINDWKEAVVLVTENEIAGTMIEEWFQRKSWPMIQVKVRSQQIDITQLTTNPWQISMEIAGSKGKYTVELNQLQQNIPFVSDDYVVMDPDRKSTAFLVYDADGYSRLKRCWESRSCPANQDSLKSIFRDFGAVLRSNLLEPMEERDKAKWKDFLQFARPHMDIEARCCVSFILNHAAPEPDCYWRVDECKKLRFGRI